MKRAPIKVGIVGYGYAGSVVHPSLIEAAEGLELHAIATRDPGRREAAQRRHGVPTFASLDDLLKNSEVELVVVATPHDTHEPLTIEALRAGRSVVCEKVLALSTRAADRMLEAARASGKLFTVFQNRRWDGDFLTVRPAIRSLSPEKS
jgi:scyllo-inositol 2-dehydrogenase (NADP+)